MRTLLLADDNLTIQRVIALTFAREAIRVVAVSDGQIAIEKMAAEQPDIVLAATTLPEVSGYDLARFMRGTPEWRGLPVLLLSGAFETVDAARLAASGANGVIEKPVEPTVVINRVKELLGLKADDKPSMTGRMITPADSPGEKKAAVPSRASSSARVTPPAGDPPTPAAESTALEVPTNKGSDYLDNLDSAFDALDQQLSKVEATKLASNPSGPLVPSDTMGYPRPAGPKPPASNAALANPVFEIDDDWFGAAESQARRADARSGPNEIAEDLRAPDMHADAPAPSHPVFEVDEGWFADAEKARADQRAEHEQLAKEMGIHDVDLPPVVPSVEVPAARSNSDFEFGMADLQAVAGAPANAPAAPIEPAAAIAPLTPIAEPVTESLPPVEPIAPMAPLSTIAPPEALLAPTDRTAADFEALLAHQDERRKPAGAAPAITTDALDQLATDVVERLQAGVLRDQWRDAMAVVAGLKVNEEKMDQIAARVADRLQLGALDERLREMNAAVSSGLLTEDKLEQIAARVSERLHLGAVEDRLREMNAAVSSVQITDEKLDQIATRLTDRLPLGAVEAQLRDVNAAVSSTQLTDEKLDQIVNRVADRLHLGAMEERLREVSAAVSSVQITDEKLDQIATRVASRLPLGAMEERMREVRSAMSSQQITDDRLDQIASNVAARLRTEGLGDQFRDSMLTAVRETVRSVVSETSERLVRAEIERITSEEAAREGNVE